MYLLREAPTLKRPLLRGTATVSKAAVGNPTDATAGSDEPALVAADTIHPLLAP